MHQPKHQPTATQLPCSSPGNCSSVSSSSTSPSSPKFRRQKQDTQGSFSTQHFTVWCNESAAGNKNPLWQSHMVVSWRARAFETGTNDFICNRTLPPQAAGQQSHTIRSCIHHHESSSSTEPEPGTMPSAPAHGGAMHFSTAELLRSLNQALLMPALWSSHCLVIKSGAFQKINRELPSLSQATFVIFCPSQHDFSSLVEQEAGAGTGMLCRGCGAPSPG